MDDLATPAAGPAGTAADPAAGAAGAAADPAAGAAAGLPPARPGGAGRPRGDTRERIQAVALALFAEQGYEATSLREIAGRLGVTKAALYYHFRSKEDIVHSFTEDYVAELDALLAWGATQPRNPQTRAELLTRYGDIVGHRLGVLRFLEQNRAALDHLLSEPDRKQLHRTQFEALRNLLVPPDAPLRDRVRASMAVASVGMGCMLYRDEVADPAELRDIVLEIARDLTGTAPPTT